MELLIDDDTSMVPLHPEGSPQPGPDNGGEAIGDIDINLLLAIGKPSGKPEAQRGDSGVRRRSGARRDGADRGAAAS